MRSLPLFAFLLSSLSLSAQVPVSNPFVDEEVPQYPVIVNPGAHVPDQLLVMLQPGVIPGELEEQFAANGFTVTNAVNSAKSMRIWTLTFSSGTDLEAALKTAKTFSSVIFAQYNHYVAHRANIPNDVQFPNMWDMDNTGQAGGTVDADIDAPEAWDITTGGMTVQGDTIVVAVIDAGFDLNQQDLVFHKNYADIPGNGIDDDNNGYIDDLDGWNAYNSNGNITSDMHGTHVAGTVGAKGNNSVGVAGVNWGVQIMPVMGSDGTEAQVVEAYTYVLDARRLYNQTNGAQGAFVVSTNSSFGVDQGQPSQYPIWCAMYDSLGSVGILSAAATANQNWNIDQVGDIPTACASDFMIAVTNTTRTDAKYPNAGYGVNTIDLGAPGTQIYSTLPGNVYGTLTGTSMATPHVAGAVALMYAAGCNQLISDYKLHPDSIALVMRNLLLSSTDPNAALAGITVTGGRLNIYNALLAVQGNCSTSGIQNAGSTTIAEIFPNPSNGNFTVGFISPENSNTTLLITNALGQQVFSSTFAAAAGYNAQQFDASALPAGVYFVQVKSGEQVSAAKRLVIQ